jgi:hypothetical protein
MLGINILIILVLAFVAMNFFLNLKTQKLVDQNRQIIESFKVEVLNHLCPQTALEADNRLESLDKLLVEVVEEDFVLPQLVKSSEDMDLAWSLLTKAHASASNNHSNGWFSSFASDLKKFRGLEKGFIEVGGDAALLEDMSSYLDSLECQAQRINVLA